MAATGLDIPGDVLGFLYGLFNMIYHYKLGGFGIHLILLYIVTVLFFMVPYFTLAFINTLAAELRYSYSRIIFIYDDGGLYFIFTMTFRLIIALVTCVTFIMLRHRDVALEKSLMMQQAQQNLGRNFA